ncbi:MAG: DUF3488 domain-containing transglutaminase family protein [Syntrophobacteraceae bacterium]|nr:DUF3488 domain-containing transglutaminase family protein [Syntrophobacteraceae bacterium]
MVKIRDALKIVTYLSVLTCFPSVAPFVEVPYTVSFGVLFGSAAYADYRGIVRIPRWILNCVSLAVLLLASMRISPDHMVEPVLEALLILIAIKLLEDKKSRDYMQIQMLCMFLLVGSSLLSLSIIFLLYFLALVVLSTTALILLAYFSQDPEMILKRGNLSRIALYAMLICSISIPMCTIFFVILPRTHYPILSFLNKSGYGRTGFTDRVLLGGVSEIQEDNSVIFRVEMEEVPDSKLYWRGVVLDQFDGASWRSNGRDVPEIMDFEGTDRIPQTIYLEPYGYSYLFALDKPVSLSLRGAMPSDAGTFLHKEPVFDRIKYRTISVASGFIPSPLDGEERYLQLPRETAARLEELHSRLTEGKDETEIIRSLFHFLSRGDYQYSTVNLPRSDTPLEDFLLRHKIGNCEYFASAMAVLLRMSGIPARLVGGYRGGYYNKTGKYYLVLQKNAHAWLEVYSRKRGGWLRLDPTPGTSLDPTGFHERSFLLRLKLRLDTVNYYWNKLVIDYDFSRQLMILQSIRASVRNADFKFDLRKIRPGKGWGLALLAVMIVGGAAVAAFRYRRKSPEEKIIAGFVSGMGRHGYHRRVGEGLEEFVGRIHEPPLKDLADAFVREFQETFYKDGPFTKEKVRSLEEYVRHL